MGFNTYGSFYYRQAQTTVQDTPLLLNTTQIANNISLLNNEIIIEETGVYVIQYACNLLVGPLSVSSVNIAINGIPVADQERILGNVIATSDSNILSLNSGGKISVLATDNSAEITDLFQSSFYLNIFRIY